MKIKVRRGRPKISRVDSLFAELDQRLEQSKRLAGKTSRRALALDLEVAHRIDWIQAQLDKRRHHAKAV